MYLTRAVIQPSSRDLFAGSRKPVMLLWIPRTSLGPTGLAILLIFFTTLSFATTFDSVSVGENHICGLLNNDIKCFGDNAAGQITTPHARAFRSVNASYASTCGIQTDDTVLCWGGVKENPPETQKFRSISVGEWHACGIRMDHTILCWGRNDFGQAKIPPGTFQSVSVSATHTCGVQTDNTVKCWGWQQDGAAKPPSDKFYAVSTSTSHTCGIKTDNTVHCWGSNAKGQSSPPPFRTFQSISAAYAHTCGIQTDNKVVCWGDNTFGQSNHPNESLQSVSAGATRSCGITMDGSLTCWGKSLPIYYAIAHMINTISMIDNVSAKGANAIEADLRFDSYSIMPSQFKHGSPCDCTVSNFTSMEVCPNQLMTCELSENSALYLSYLAKKPNIALFIVDSKLDNLSAGGKSVAGINVVQHLEEYLFKKGYQGKVIISAAKLSDWTYMNNAIHTANRSPFSDRIYFSIDQETGNTSQVLEKLSMTTNRVYGVGISALSAQTFYGEIEQAARNELQGTIGLSYIWTLDKDSSMNDYLKRGVRGIITNNPQQLVRLLQSQGKSLARPEDPIFTATGDRVYK